MSVIAKNCRSARGSRTLFTAASATVLALALAGGGFFATVSAATPTATQYTAPLQPFFMNYMKDANSAHYNPTSMFVVPTVWLYSPQGKLMASADSNASLEALIKGFPPAKTSAPADQADLKTVLGVVAQSSKIQQTLTPAVGKWTAVLFLTNTPACHHCAHFNQSMQNFAHAHAAPLDTITVMLTTP